MTVPIIPYDKIQKNQKKNVFNNTYLSIIIYSLHAFQMLYAFSLETGLPVSNNNYPLETRRLNTTASKTVL